MHLPFSIAGNFLKAEGAKFLAEALHVNSSMTKLNIWDSNIGVEGATAIVNAAPTQMRTLCGDMFHEGQTEADLSGKKLGAEGAILVAWDLRAGFVSSSMNKLNVLSNFIGTEGGQALVDAAPPQLQTFCGFEEGQTEANLSNKRLGPGDAVLLAWELTNGYVSSSMNSLK